MRFERSGPKVLLIHENLDYRAVSNDADERRAVRDSFAESVLWGFTVAAEEKDPEKIDLTAPAEPPDGPPIGGTDDDWDWQD